MLFPCEMIVRRVLPAFRAYLVKKLYEKHKIKQSDIANLLGITQPSVSLYLSGERGGFDDIFNSKKVIEHLHELDAIIEKLVDDDALSEQDLMKNLCSLCSTLRTEQAYCEIHGQLDKGRKVPCGLCDECFGHKKEWFHDIKNPLNHFIT